MSNSKETQALGTTGITESFAETSSTVVKQETQALGTTGITESFAETSSTVGKRLRRERSYAGRAHNGNAKKDRKTKKRGNNSEKDSTPIFLKKTHEMITICDSNLAEWTPDGEMFVVKDQPRFAAEVIPKYFDHKKFASFARQLNFYGFRKIQVRPVKNEDIDTGTIGHVTYCNENFKRDAEELLCKIFRSTKNRGSTGNAQKEQQRQIDSLKADVVSYKGQVQQLTTRLECMERKFSYLEAQLNNLATAKSLKCGVEPGQPLSMTNFSTNVDIDRFRTLSLTSMDSLEQLIKPDEILPTASKVAYDCNPSSTSNRTISNSALKPSPPTLPPHPGTRSGLPPGNVPLPLPQRVRTISNSALKPSPPTLPPHPGTRSGLPPGNVPLPLPQRVSSFNLPLDDESFLRGLSNDSVLRGLSNESDTYSMGLTPFEKNYLTHVMDENNITGDGTAAASSKNFRLKSEQRKKTKKTELDTEFVSIAEK